MSKAECLYGTQGGSPLQEGGDFVSDEIGPAARYGGSRLIPVLLGVAAAAVLLGMLGEPNIEVFGLDLAPVTVSPALFLLGFFSGVYARRR